MKRTKNLNRLKNGTTHGILQFLADKGVHGARAMDIIAEFPSLRGSSTLTYMRRDGLIAKLTTEQTAPWIICKYGLALLCDLGQYGHKCPVHGTISATPKCPTCEDVRLARWAEGHAIPDYDIPVFAKGICALQRAANG